MSSRTVVSIADNAPLAPTAMPTAAADALSGASRVGPSEHSDQAVLSMALYLSRFSYTTDAKKALLEQPQDRSGAAREMAESLGGKLLGFWYAFREFDGVFLMRIADPYARPVCDACLGRPLPGRLKQADDTQLRPLRHRPPGVLRRRRTA
jgi:uncharacterized protein with GYD domain